MKITLIAAVMMPLVLVGCVGIESKKEPAKPIVTSTASDIAQNSLDYVGTYNAKIPCTDCDYTMARLQLNQYGQYRYMEQNVKNGGPVGQPVVFQGKYTWDKKAPIIRLLNARNMHFFVAENEVVLLSQPITSYSEITIEPKFKKAIRQI
ncbi:copper resistance protein NlpE N-terminal domain-containing protein [Wohlfahrtiimonas larvae]|uniref:Copper resistance protein NlpE n=1 Tax=Wohlfahrtiimonas larvae TaxID=1157986 RepID=A0ABP9MM32_9GAMM|nr:copper resistance protein NlpE N-terminal domain-containing protein [Wohlfahrtiimonas larvae]